MGTHGKKAEIVPKVVYAPVSVGQLVDQISILELKTRFITAPEKAANIARELSCLKQVAAEYELALDDADYRELKNANKILWSAEDAIREKERASQFDDEFIALARQIYRTNDKRAAIKRRISTTHFSYIAEEKQYLE